MSRLREGKIAFRAKLAYAARYNFMYLQSYFPYPSSSKAPALAFPIKSKQ